MASSQPSSPTRSIASDHFALSPRSRLAKRLAALDSDGSDNELQHSAARKLAPRTPPDGQWRVASSQAGSDAAAPSSSQEKGGSVAGERSDDEDDEDILRPRGKLAARLHAREQKDASAGEDSDTSVGDVRERVRRRLQQRTATPTVAEETTVQDTPTMGTIDADSDEGVILAAKPRRLKQRVSRTSATPERAAAHSPVGEVSPGLFVTPTKDITADVATPSSAASVDENDSGSDEDLPSLKSSRFQALVARKQAERLAREAEEKAKQDARQAAALERAKTFDEDEDMSDADSANDVIDEDGQRLTQLTDTARRPARKAGKKALEEMNRETQRMARSLQLVHEAKTRIKFTKGGLFDKFNFIPEGGLVEDKTQAEVPLSSSRPVTPKSVGHTDEEVEAETPGSSPPSVRRLKSDALGKDAMTMDVETARQEPLIVMPALLADDSELPDIAELASNIPPLSAAKRSTHTSPKDSKSLSKKRVVRVALPTRNSNVTFDDEDAEFIIEKPTTKSKIDAAFARVPQNQTKEHRSMLTLRALAHINSPEKKLSKRHDKSVMSAGQLHYTLQQRAREQARVEKERRLEVLRARGIDVQTEAERERERDEIDDMLARARQEAEEIQIREKQMAKRKAKENGEVDPLAWDDDDESGDEYQGEDEDEGGDDEGVELSGSEDEHADDQEDEDVQGESEPVDASKAMVIDDEAESGSSDSGSEPLDPEEAEERNRWGTPDVQMPEVDLSAGEDEAESASPSFVKPRRARKQVMVLSDDEMDKVMNATPKTKAPVFKSPPTNNQTESPQCPTSVLRSATKTFIPGLAVQNGDPAGLGLTQIFAGTMDDSQAGFANASPSQPMPTFGGFDEVVDISQNVLPENDGRIADSQPVQGETQAVETQFSLGIDQSQTHGFDSLLDMTSYTQASQMIEPTQDGGYHNWTPLKERFIEAPPSTVDTVINTAPLQESDSPVLKRTGRLRRRVSIRPTAESDDDLPVAADQVEEDEFGFGTTNAFSSMKAAAEKADRQKLRKAFDAKNTKAKEMVEEQAEESEDEYAGLGGVDGDASEDEDAASVHEMIDDATQGEKDDERKLAAFYADRERADDAQQIDKLFHDVTTGQLRRKRGADYDLSDSDDGGEARRRMKRRQFAKQQKALLADERISKVAENPRNMAFLKTIQDAGSDDDEHDLGYLLGPEAKDQSQEDTPSQSQSQQPTQQGAYEVVIPSSQPSMGPPPSRMALGPVSSQAGNRLPANARRTKDGRKPATLTEIRETLSNIIPETSNLSLIAATELEQDSDNEDDLDVEFVGASAAKDAVTMEEHNKENALANPRRTPASGKGNMVVVDRISLRRQESSSLSTTSFTSTRLAFAAPNTASGDGVFKHPALLRRATTNMSLTSNTSSTSAHNSISASSSSTQLLGAGRTDDSGKIKKKGAGKKSGISHFARENDRRAAVAEKQRKREERRLKNVGGRGRAVMGSLFERGEFA